MFTSDGAMEVQRNEVAHRGPLATVIFTIDQSSLISISVLRYNVDTNIK